MLILVLESSTTSAKALLYSSSKGVLDMRSTLYAPEYNKNGMQDGDYVLAETLRMGRLVASGQPVDMIAVSGVWHSVMCCDRNMKPVTPVYAWSYTGAASYTRELRKDPIYTKDYYRRSGCIPHVTYTPFKLMHLKDNGQSLDNLICCEQSAYNYFHLTGKCVSSHSTISGGGLINIDRIDYDEETLHQIGISRDQLPELRYYHQTAPLNNEGAALLGLKSGIPVIPPMPDGGLNQVGASALKPGSAMTFSVGTSAALRMTTDKPLLSDPPGTWCYLSPGTDWISGAATAGACNCLDWALETLFPKGTSHADVQRAELPNRIPMFLPFLFGERCPGWRDDRYGAFTDMTGSFTATDMYYGVMQGVLLNLYQCYRILCDLNGVPKTIKLSGGILRSKIWTQMCCDLFDHDMECPDMEQASMSGAVALALQLGGILPSIREFPEIPAKTVKCRPEFYDTYQEAFSNYLYWYQKLIPN